MSGQAFNIFLLSSFAQTIKAFIGRFICVLVCVTNPGDGGPTSGPGDISHAPNVPDFFDKFNGVSDVFELLHLTVGGDVGRSNGIVERNGRNGINGISCEKYEVGGEAGGITGYCCC